MYETVLIMLWLVTNQPLRFIVHQWHWSLKGTFRFPKCTRPAFERTWYNGTGTSSIRGINHYWWHYLRVAGWSVMTTILCKSHVVCSEQLSLSHYKSLKLNNFSHLFFWLSLPYSESGWLKKLIQDFSEQSIILLRATKFRSSHPDVSLTVPSNDHSDRWKNL